MSTNATAPRTDEREQSHPDLQATLEMLTARINACKHPRAVYNALLALAPFIREARTQQQREQLLESLKAATAERPPHTSNGRPNKKEKPNGSQQKPTEANESLKSNSKSKSNSNSKSNSKREGDDACARGARFTPPTLEQAEAYFQEQGATILQATRFFNKRIKQLH